MSQKGYTRESVERAFDLHQREGRIQSWHRSGNGYVAICHMEYHGVPVTLRDLREAHRFVAGLASAAHAQRQALQNRAVNEARTSAYWYAMGKGVRHYLAEQYAVHHADKVRHVLTTNNGLTPAILDTFEAWYIDAMI